MSTWFSLPCLLGVTKRTDSTEIESVTERMLHVVSEVHNTTSSSGLPFYHQTGKCVRDRQLSTIGHDNVYLGSSRLRTIQSICIDLAVAPAGEKIRQPLSQEKI